MRVAEAIDRSVNLDCTPFAPKGERGQAASSKPILLSAN